MRWVDRTTSDHFTSKKNSVIIIACYASLQVSLSVGGNRDTPAYQKVDIPQTRHSGAKHGGAQQRRVWRGKAGHIRSRQSEIGPRRSAAHEARAFVFESLTKITSSLNIFSLASIYQILYFEPVDSKTQHPMGGTERGMARRDGTRRGRAEQRRIGQRGAERGVRRWKRGGSERLAQDISSPTFWILKTTIQDVSRKHEQIKTHVHLETYAASRAGGKTLGGFRRPGTNLQCWE